MVQKVILRCVIKFFRELIFSIEFVAMVCILGAVIGAVVYLGSINIPDIPSISQKAEVAQELGVNNKSKLIELEQRVEEQTKLIEQPIIIEREVFIRVPTKQNQAQSTNTTNNSKLHNRAQRLRNTQQSANNNR